MATLYTVLQALETIAPLRGAANWDNVGLLIKGTRPIRRVGVCIDLTPAVLDELMAADVDFIVAYHPTLFRGLKRITGATAIENTLLQVIRAGIHLYAPHTALDAAVDGMADWLAEAIVHPSQAHQHRPIAPVDWDPRVGVGRQGVLDAPVSVRQLVPRIKAWLGIDHLRVAGDIDAPRTTYAVCPGAGGSVLGPLSDTDLLLTGEMGHHEVLAAVARGATVVLTDHTHCERGFLMRYAARIHTSTGLDVLVSAVDTDPLSVV